MQNQKTTKKMIAVMAKQSIKFSRLRNVFVIITIVLASALLSAILMFAAGQKQITKKELSHRQQVSYYNLTAAQTEALQKDERIAHQIQVKTGVLSEMDGFDVMPYYASAFSDEIQIGELESGSLPVAENEIAVQAAMLEKMGVSPALGSPITLTFYNGATETFTVSGILKGGETAKQFPVFLSKDYAQNGSQLKDMPYEVHAKLYNAEHLHAAVCKELMYTVGADAGVERKYVSPSKAFLDSLSVDTQSLLLYTMVGTVILLACILVIYGVFYLSVIGRVHQFGQLRTIGMTEKQIRALISREGGILFLCASPAGIAIGITAGRFLCSEGFSIFNTVLIAALVFAVIFAVIMVSVHKPARLAAAVSPMEALRYVPQDGMQKATGKKLCRRLSPFGLGVMNFSKNKKKAAITMLSLALGGILFMTAATYMSSFDKDNYARQGYFKDAEFHITYAPSAVALDENGMSGIQAKAPLDIETVQKINALDGVRQVKEIKNFGVKFDLPKHDEYDNADVIYPLTEAETKEIKKYLESGSADYDKLISGNYILAAGNDNAKGIYGWQFEVGDTVVLHYYDGVKTASKEVTVLGILNRQYVLDHNGLEGWFLMPEQAILKELSYNSLTAHLLVSTDPNRETAVGESLQQLVADRAELTLETLADRRVTYTQNANQLFGAISGLALFIMMFSILSMMNTLITNIVTRKQELAMLESIGMCKNQLYKMLIGESLILVFAAVGITLTVGTLCGYLLTTMLYRTGAFYMAFRFPTGFALAYAGVLTVIPILISIVSMHGFSKESLTERLKGAE